MSHTLKRLPNSEAELTVVVSPSEFEKHLKPAAERVAQRANIKGFRPGKVPYEMLVREVGEVGILHEALEAIVKESFYQAVTQEKLHTIGMPKVEVKKLAPQNAVEYTATVALMPKVTLPDISTVRVVRKAAVADEKKVEETLEALRGMQAIEVIKEGPAEKTDKLVIDMDMKRDGVSVDGGQAKDYQVYLSEDHYIPGFNDQLVGLRSGDTKEFRLEFPKDHYQKQLAGATIDFFVTVKQVFVRSLPEVNDAFAKKLGKDSVEDLKKLLAENALREANQRADQEAEIEMLNTLVEKATFEDVPEVILNAEKEKMFYELKRDLERHGITIEQYLSDIKKNEAEVMAGFAATALRRAKAALVSREVAIEQKMEIAEADIDAEIKTMKETYKEDAESVKKLNRPEVRDSIASAMQNRKVMEYLKEKIIINTNQ